jgi:uncharacterized phage protein (TIGR01671 family)
MSREIKFRVWGKIEKEYIRYPFVWLSLFDSPDGLKIEDNKDLVVEQYTGLKDKNGKEIYEGDIIQETILADDTTGGTYRYEVYWDEDTLCWSIKGISDIDYHLRDDLWETNASREVIGNIHENPELIGGEE